MKLFVHEFSTWTYCIFCSKRKLHWKYFFEKGKTKTFLSRRVLSLAPYLKDVEKVYIFCWNFPFLPISSCFQQKWQREKGNDTINACFESDLPPQPPLSEESCKVERVVFLAFIFTELQSDQHFLVDISRLCHLIWQMIFFGQTDDARLAKLGIALAQGRSVWMSWAGC